MTTYKLGKIIDVRIGVDNFLPLQVFIDAENKNAFYTTFKFECTNIFLINLLRDANKKFLHELKNMPIKVKIVNNWIISFRILTEVL